MNPGWYVDPRDDLAERFWNVSAWTSEVRPAIVSNYAMGAEENPPPLSPSVRTAVAGGPDPYSQVVGELDIPSTGEAAPDVIGLRQGLHQRLLLLVLVGVLGLGGAFAIRSAILDAGGGDTPSDAVQQFVEAMRQSDPVGMVAMIDPYERDSIADPAARLLSEVERLQLINRSGAESLGAETVGESLSIDVSELELRERRIDEDLVRVEIRSGRVRGRAADFESPVSIDSGNEVEDAVDRFNEDLEALDLDFQKDFDGDVFVATVDRGGRWYVSIYYSIAEYLREESGERFPQAGTGPEPEGADSPELALEQLLRALESFHAEGVLTVLDPEEAGVLYDYASLYLDRIDAAVREERRRDDFDWEFRSVQVSSENRNGRRFAQLDEIDVSIEADGDSARLRYGGGCFDLSTSESSETICVDGSEIDQERSITQALGRIGTGVSVVERDGRWYVSIVPTVLYTYVDYLAGLEPGDLDDLLDDIEREFG